VDAGFVPHGTAQGLNPFEANVEQAPLSWRAVDASGSIDAAEAGRNLKFVVVFDPIEGVEFRLDDLASVGRLKIPTNCREHQSSGEDHRGADQERHVHIGLLPAMRTLVSGRYSCLELQPSQSGKTRKRLRGPRRGWTRKRSANRTAGSSTSQSSVGADQRDGVQIANEAVLSDGQITRHRTRPVRLARNR
jgi:hypothetical protein